MTPSPQPEKWEAIEQELFVARTRAGISMSDEAQEFCAKHFASVLRRVISEAVEADRRRIRERVEKVMYENHEPAIPDYDYFDGRRKALEQALSIIEGEKK